MLISEKDKTILRKLAEKLAKINDISIQKERADMWRRLNRLERIRPMIWVNIDEIPWSEMDINNELRLQTGDPFCREFETQLRRTIYKWEHLCDDMVVEGKIFSPLVIQNSRFGIEEKVDIVKTDVKSQTMSKKFYPQIHTEKDIEKIKMPKIKHDVEASERNYQILSDIFGDIVPVEKRGLSRIWFAPCDQLIKL